MRLILAAAALFLAAAAPQEVSHDALTSEMAGRIAKAVPKAKVSIDGPLTIKLSGTALDGFQINLDRIAGFCAANPAEDCEAQKEAFIRGVIEGASGANEITRANLRVVVRSADYAAALQEVMTKDEGALITRPVGEGLVALLAADHPSTVTMVRTADLKALRLNAEDAYELGRSNVLATLASLPTAAALKSDIVGFVGQDYDASILVADGWKELAAETGGKLFVTVSSDNFVVAGLADDEDVRTRLRRLAQDGYASADRPISPEVYRWSDKGWVPVR